MNRILKRLMTVAAALLMAASLYAEETSISPDGTYLFAKRDTCDLYLDVYNPAAGS